MITGVLTLVGFVVGALITDTLSGSGPALPSVPRPVNLPAPTTAEIHAGIL